jgi:dolichol-phosphate mannosyltransferase
MDKIYIVMPAYNEGKNIGATIEEWYPVVEKLGKNARLIIFDDGSKDDTFNIAKNLQNKFTQLIVETKSNSGHGPTCLYAYKYCIRNKADYIFQTDSDGQTSPGEFWDFFNNKEESDFIIGYRKNREDGSNRIFISRVLRVVILLLFGVNIKDANTPFRWMNTQKLIPIIDSIPDHFFLVNVMITIGIIKSKESCKWIPISFKSRQKGINSINNLKIIRIGLQALKEFLYIKKNI